MPIEFRIPEGMADGFIQMIDPGSEFSVRVLHVYPSVPKQAAYLTSEMSMFIDVKELAAQRRKLKSGCAMPYNFRMIASRKQQIAA